MKSLASICVHTYCPMDLAMQVTASMIVVVVSLRARIVAGVRSTWCVATLVSWASVTFIDIKVPEGAQGAQAAYSSVET